jgi:hypothetical protein
MHVFGTASATLLDELHAVLLAQCADVVLRVAPARSTVPHPQSIELELALRPKLIVRGFRHHERLVHPRTGQRFEYDFWRSHDGVAIEVMGYRADDEIYKNILKFHVHEGTRTGVVLVPRYKWISARRTDTNFSAALKALAFADAYMSVGALSLSRTTGERHNWPARGA